jgi:hypothetical protein
MTADPLHQVAGLKSRLDPGLDVGCWLLLAQPASVLVDVDEQRDFDEPRADLSGGRLKRVALIEDRDQLWDDDILIVVQMALRQSETVVLAAYLSAHRTMINGSALCAALAVTERE